MGNNHQSECDEISDNSGKFFIAKHGVGS
jgi:hypothetical protein